MALGELFFPQTIGLNIFGARQCANKTPGCLHEKTRTGESLIPG